MQRKELKKAGCSYDDHDSSRRGSCVLLKDGLSSGAIVELDMR